MLNLSFGGATRTVNLLSSMSRAESFVGLLAASGTALQLTRSERDGAHEVFAWCDGSIKLILSTFNSADADEVMALAA